jgi:hypothetical protein
MEMKNFLNVVVCSFAFIAAAGPASATTTINFDDVSSMTIIDNYYESMGILFATYSPMNEPAYSDGHAYARSSSRSSSGSNIIGSGKSGYPYLNDAHNIGVAQFLRPTNQVGIWANPYSTQTLDAWLKAYDSSGSLLNSLNVNSTQTGQAELLSISRPSWDIARLEFSGNNSRAAFDTISYNIAPEPLSSVLFLTGGAALAASAYRKRRNKS